MYALRLCATTTMRSYRSTSVPPFSLDFLSCKTCRSSTKPFQIWRRTSHERGEVSQVAHDVHEAAGEPIPWHATRTAQEHAPKLGHRSSSRVPCISSGQRLSDMTEGLLLERAREMSAIRALMTRALAGDGVPGLRGWGPGSARQPCWSRLNGWPARRVSGALCAGHRVRS